MDVILFNSDWDKYYSASVDLTTKNKSFIKLALTYKKMGIKNYKFILAILDQGLIGVDPYDPNLSEEMKFRINMECKYNPWYFFREVARIPPNSGNNPIPFQANRGNIALFWCYFNHVDFGLLQPRQTGKSVSTDVLNTGMMYIWGENTKINLITKDNKLRNANIERLKVMRDLLPEYIHYTDPLDADNSELMTCIRLGNRYLTAVGRNDVNAADKLGRGLTVPNMHFDELAYINLIGVSLPVALASGSAARDEARRENQPYGNIYTTTAGNITTRDGEFAYRFLTGGCPWSEEFFDLPDQKTLHRVVEKGTTGKKPLVYGAFNHRQLGRTDQWLYNTLRESGSFGEIADRDFFNIWTVGGEGSPLSSDEKDKLKNNMREPSWTEITDDGYTLRWYIPKDEVASRMMNGRFVMGTDPSELLGEDNDATGVVVVDVETHEVMCVGRYNESSVPSMGNFFATMLLRYPNILWIPERKSIGISLIDHVILILHTKGVDPFRRIFNRIVNESSERENDFRDIQTPLSARQPSFYDRFKRYFGYATSGNGEYSRDNLFKVALPSAMHYGVRTIYDKPLSTELLALTIRNGRIDHAKGNHDDLVVSLLLAHWLLIQGKNLSYYGINVPILGKSKLRDKEPNQLEKYHEEKEQQGRKEFEELIDRLRGEKNPMIAAKLEMRLKQLSKRVNIDDGNGVGIDAMLNQARAERTRRVRINRYSKNSWY
ncbi:hypothetical protein [Pseudomonas aeruginosa]|uniref:hypothetical protein n=1 Tax=Pseudomonas aeruginosa TaxID=287 RepID=UPI003FD1DD0F